MVQEFHQKFGLTICDRPTLPSEADCLLRDGLLREEQQEAHDAQSMVAAADALGDLMYVILGTGVTFGINLWPVFQEIHRSNMSKLWTSEEVKAYISAESLIATRVQDSGDGRCYLVKNKDGKVIKSPSYSPADIARELRLQGYVE